MFSGISHQPTEELTANCGGEPCTPTEKEDSGTVIGPGLGQELLPPPRNEHRYLYLQQQRWLGSQLSIL